MPLQLTGDGYVRKAPEFFRKRNIVEYEIDCLEQTTIVAEDERDE